MSDNITEKITKSQDFRDIPILNRNTNGKYLSPLSPDLFNLSERIKGDDRVMAKNLSSSLQNRGLLKVEVKDASSVNEILIQAGKTIQNSLNGKLPSNEDLKHLATYLDWSYQEQVGEPANQSTLEKATENGVGARDVWVLFTAIKNKLEK